MMSQKFYQWVVIYTSLYMWCTYYNKIVHMAANDKQPILFNKIAHHGIKTQPGSVVVGQADPQSWTLQKDPIGTFHNIQLNESAWLTITQN